MKKNFTHIICFWCLVTFFGACKDRNPDPIPHCPVYIIIYRDSRDSDLAIGRMKTFNNGRGDAGCYGVVVVNLNNEDFLAYEMGCPNDWRYGGMIVKHELSAREMPDYFECSECKTKFSILDGQPMPGAVSRYPMKAYRVLPYPSGGSMAFQVLR
jgi:hypothetical protein